MIIDKLDHLSNYTKCIGDMKIRDIIKEYESKEKGDYKITEELVLKRVVSTTKHENVAKIEMHRFHIDIQIPLDKEELYYIYDIDEVVEQSEYDSVKDVVTYTTPNRKRSEVYVKVGQFIMLEPYEIHQPQIAVVEPESINKIVLKVKC